MKAKHHAAAWSLNPILVLAAVTLLTVMVKLGLSLQVEHSGHFAEDYGYLNKARYYLNLDFAVSSRSLGSHAAGILYSIVVSPWMLVPNNALQFPVVIAINSLLSAGTIVLATLAVWDAARTRSLAVPFIFAAMPPVFLFNFYALTENLMLCLAAAAAWLCTKVPRDDSGYWPDIVLVAVIVASPLARPPGLAVLLGVVATVLALWPKIATARRYLYLLVAPLLTISIYGAIQFTPVDYFEQAGSREEVYLLSLRQIFGTEGSLVTLASHPANVFVIVMDNQMYEVTGGQPVEGSPSPADIANQVWAEGVKRIAVVSDDPDKYPTGWQWAPHTTFHHRDELDAVQKELREWPGVSLLLYDQTCAAEKRRRRKRGLMVDPPRRVFINERVCEGCGDCGVKSNCVSVLPVETEFGRKREIDQSNCNKDFSCVKGFCPSFVTVHGGTLKKRKGVAKVDFAALPEPTLPELAQPWNILVTGIGGTGVVTIGALLGMAAHLEGKGGTVLDQTGLAQKGGAVTTHVRIAREPKDIHAVRIAAGEADLVLGCDMVVVNDYWALSKIRADRTRCVLNAYEAMPGTFTRQPDMQFPAAKILETVKLAMGGRAPDVVDATHVATTLMGDSIATNLFMLGYAWQRGLVPVSHAALMRAIELNGAAVEMNKTAFNWGRMAAHDLATVQQAEVAVAFGCRNLLIANQVTGHAQVRGIVDPDVAGRVHGLELLPGGAWFSEAGVQPLPGADKQAKIDQPAPADANALEDLGRGLRAARCRRRSRSRGW